jgi:hypothetical protein
VQQAGIGDDREASYNCEPVNAGTASIGKEFPMELTASITAILAIMSLSFLAAIILGMI